MLPLFLKGINLLGHTLNFELYQLPNVQIFNNQEFQILLVRVLLILILVCCGQRESILYNNELMSIPSASPNVPIYWLDLELPSPPASDFDSASRDGFVEAIMSCDVAKPCHLPALNSDEKRFLSAHETFSLAPLIVVHFVLAVGDAEEFSQSLVLQCLSPFFPVSARSVQVSHP